MRLEKIRIDNFRNHRLTEFEPGSSVTVIFGNNGIGKTSLLEAVHYCALTRGFSGSSDADCLAFGSDFFSIRATFISDTGVSIDVRVHYSPETEKRIFVNEQEVNVFSRHIGSIPCVSFLPSDHAIVTGAPAERRKFIDAAISQHDRKYLSDLIQFRKVLQQRNALLASYDQFPNVAVNLDIWTEQMAVIASSIVSARLVFVKEIEKIFSDIYAWFPEGEEPSMMYHSSFGRFQGEGESAEALAQLFMQRYEQTRKQEIRRGLTLSGPHRDEIFFYKKGKEIRKFASQGQQRGYLIALKIALHHYLREKHGENPVTLFDDLYSELDQDVAGKVTETLRSCGQVFITSTQEQVTDGVTNFHVNSQDV